MGGDMASRVGKGRGKVGEGWQGYKLCGWWAGVAGMANRFIHGADRVITKINKVLADLVWSLIVKPGPRSRQVEGGDRQSVLG
jgi:hypothetical protein